MEKFIVSARKYRPDTFNSVVGQKSISTTLKNAIINNHLAHAYLFCGPRGVGKTTSARIFAKTINCTNLDEKYEACNKCESCEGFNENRSYNIHELDAASNNSVEDIRNLIEQVRVPPQIGTHSVYIIDEVHMLSSQAFNAFLKTLEEPPEHAIFILATTEKHKILPTILSRCQIFDFNRITVEDAVDHLAYVAGCENIEVEREALNIIAQKADGAMRDALSLFDQIVSFSGEKVTYKDAIDNLNVLDYGYYFRIVKALLENDISQSLLIFNEILDHGFDGHHFITGLSSHFRDIIVCKNPETIQLLEVGDAIKEKYNEQAKECSVSFLFKALSISNTCDLSYKASTNKRLQVELALMKISQITVEPVAVAPTVSATPVPPQKQVKNEEKQTVQAEKQEKSASSLPVRPKTTSISLSEIKETEKEKTSTNTTQTQEIPQNSNLSESVTQEQVEAAWIKFAEYLNKMPRLYSAFKAQKPILSENFVLQLSVPNEPLCNKIIEIKTKILKFMRAELKNSKIDLNPVVATASDTDKPKIYTAADKYKFLSSKNKNVEVLKQNFGLDY